MSAGGTASHPRPSLPEGMVERVLAHPDVRADAVARGREQMARGGWPCAEKLAAALVGSLVEARHP